MCSAATATYSYGGKPLSRSAGAPSIVSSTGGAANPTGEMEQQWPKQVQRFALCEPCSAGAAAACRPAWCEAASDACAGECAPEPTECTGHACPTAGSVNENASQTAITAENVRLHQVRCIGARYTMVARRVSDRHRPLEASSRVAGTGSVTPPSAHASSRSSSA
jgi:hypothetical protein